MNSCWNNVIHFHNVQVKTASPSFGGSTKRSSAMSASKSFPRLLRSFPAWRAWDSATRNAKSPTPLTSQTLSIPTARRGQVFCSSSLGGVTSTSRSPQKSGRACWTCWEVRAALRETAECSSTTISHVSSFTPELMCWDCERNAGLMHDVMPSYTQCWIWLKSAVAQLVTLSSRCLLQLV